MSRYDFHFLHKHSMLHACTYWKPPYPNILGDGIWYDTSYITHRLHVCICLLAHSEDVVCGTLGAVSRSQM